MAITAASAAWFLPFALPICLWVAWSDLKFMKIPNQSVLALWVVFAVVGLIALPFDAYLWRYVHIVVVLAFGFVLNLGGAMGAGDAKFLAAMAPLAAFEDLRLILILFAAVLLAAFVTHRLFKHIGPFRRATADWVSWERRKFPMGFALGPTLAIYLGLGVFLGA